MLPAEILMGFCLSVLLLSLSPGPSNLYIMACTIDSGRGAGVAAAGGMAIGSLTYTVLVALGLASLILLSPVGFILLKLAGAGYLIYLGLKSVAEYRKPERVTGNGKAHRHVFRQSIIVELTNPKTGLFFIAFLPQFANPDSPDMAWQLVQLGAIYAVIAFCCDLSVVMLSGQLSVLLNRRADGSESSPWVTGQKLMAALILLGLGGYILIAELIRGIMA